MNFGFGNIFAHLCIIIGIFVVSNNGYIFPRIPKYMNVMYFNEDSPDLVKPNHHAINREEMGIDLIDYQSLKIFGRRLAKFHGLLTTQIFADSADKNVVYSPLSVSTMLSMLAFGAQRNTLKEILQSTELPSNTIVMRAFVSLMNIFKQTNGVKVNFANKIYVENSVKLEEDYQQLIEAFFESKPEALDFVDTNEAVNIINEWSRKETNNVITEIVKPDDLVDTLMIMLNAIYFEGVWELAFNPLNTINQEFYINSTRSVDVPMMKIRGEFNYGTLYTSKVHADYIELPYASENSPDDFSMFIIFPKKRFDLKSIEQNIVFIRFNILFENNKRTVDLWLPKFSIESKINLQPVLEKMDIKQIFGPRANLHELSLNQNLHVSKMMQSARIEVNEKGSVAAAVTATDLENKFGDDFTKYGYFIDQPFLCAIVMRSTGIPLFYARINDPSKNE